MCNGGAARGADGQSGAGTGACGAGVCGATATLLLLHGESLHVAWLGDCRAVLCRDGRAVELTVDHSLTDPAERQRAVSEGGIVESNRLGGFLEVARAMGDYDASIGSKPAGLSAVPDVLSQPLSSDDEFVLLASDGLWNVVQTADAVKLARDELAAYDGDASMASDKLVETALKRHADDNVSVMIVCLHLKAAELEPPRRPRLQLMRPTRTVVGAPPASQTAATPSGEGAGLATA